MSENVTGSWRAEERGVDDGLYRLLLGGVIGWCSAIVYRCGAIIAPPPTTAGLADFVFEPSFHSRSTSSWDDPWK